MMPQRNTIQRQVILEELKNLSSHPTAQEMYEIVRHRLPRISLGTVYRNLELLTDFGIIRKIQVGGRKARFDAIIKDHDHIHCIRCGRVDDLPVLPPERAEIPNDGPGGWQIQECRVEFVGICPDCFADASGNEQQK